MNRRNFFKLASLSAVGSWVPFSAANVITTPKYHEIVEWTESEIMVHDAMTHLGRIKLHAHQKATLSEWMEQGKMIHSHYSCRQSGKSLMGEIFARYKGTVLGEKTLIIRHTDNQVCFRTANISHQLMDRYDLVKWNNGGMVKMMSAWDFKHSLCGKQLFLQ